LTDEGKRVTSKPTNQAVEKNTENIQLIKSIPTRANTDMKLLTHNMLACHIKGVTNNYPLLIEATKIETRDADFNPDFLRHIFPRIQWPAFLQGAETLGCRGTLPNDPVPESALEDEGFLKQFHHALLEVVLEEGFLICPETQRRFPVCKGIPNLLLNEDEC